MTGHKGQKIWIIGASSGIGHALAAELASQDASLVLSARSEDKLNALNTELGGGHQVVTLDVADPAACEAAAAQIDGLDTVIFLAAIYAPHSADPKPIDFMHKMISVNFGGAINTVYAVRPVFERQGHGQIVLCGSVAGYRGLPNGQPYCATKAAVINYAESLKVELEDQNIDVKVINPGFVKTPLTDKNDFPMPMMITPDKAAKAIATGLSQKGFEIHFPKVFTWIMKTIHLLPAPLYFMLTRRMK